MILSNNGIQDPNEPGIAGVFKLVLHDSSGKLAGEIHYDQAPTALQGINPGSSPS